MNRQLKEALRQILPRSIGQRRILGGPLRGRLLVTSWYDYPAAILGRTERPLLNWFTSIVGAGETWLDIGAHYGYTAIALCRLVGPAGRVYAFEPMVSSAGCVARTRALNSFQQLTVVPVALGNGGDLGIQSLPQVRGMVDSTFVGISFEESFLVARLDWLWPRICGQREQIDGVKIDVQGMELQVLKGMARILREHKPKLAVEFHKGVDRRQLLDLLNDTGYSRPGFPIEPLQGESDPQYADDRSYAFLPDCAAR
jgi:FkbM family methyltransferase